jgi:hypothetical protein
VILLGDIGIVKQGDGKEGAMREKAKIRPQADLRGISLS